MSAPLSFGLVDSSLALNAARDISSSTRYNPETLERNHANRKLSKDALRRASCCRLNHNCGWSENISRGQRDSDFYQNHVAPDAGRR
jgi:hypothetical protein